MPSVLPCYVFSGMTLYGAELIVTFPPASVTRLQVELG